MRANALLPSHLRSTERRPLAGRFPALLLTLVLAMAAGACSDSSSPSPSPPTEPPGPADHVRMNEAWLIGTHNSYWVDRGVSTDLFSSGVQQSLLDQLVADHARAIEIDVHPDETRPGNYRVFHTVPGNSLCDDLADCLRPLRLLHAALPRHEVIHVIVELKKFSGPSFDARHTVDQLEGIFEQMLGRWLFRPRDLLDVCDPDGADPDPDLAACVARVGWPTLAELRGRFVVSVLGNFDDLLPQAKGTLDWAQFALHGDLRRRSAFSMASSWKTDWDALPEKIRAELSREDLARALRRTVFLQVEDTADPNLAPFLAANGMVRIGAAHTTDDQATRIALGAQILQGDTPWVQLDDRGPAQPVRPLDATLGAIVEPGERLELAIGGAQADAYAWRDVRTRATALWSTVPSVGVPSDAIPCLVAASDPLTPRGASVAICRDKVHAERRPNAPLGSGDPDAERIRLALRVCRAGRCDVTTLPAPSGFAAQVEVGVALGLEVVPAGSGACARALVATDVDADGAFAWQEAAPAQCLDEPLRAQGLLALGSGHPGAALFAGTRLEIDGRVETARPLVETSAP